MDDPSLNERKIVSLNSRTPLYLLLKKRALPTHTFKRFKAQAGFKIIAPSKNIPKIMLLKNGAKQAVKMSSPNVNITYAS